MVTEPEERPRILAEGLSRDLPPEPSERAAWLLAPGEGGDIWDQFLSKNEGSIGWNETGDLADLDTPEDFRQVIRDSHPKSGPVKVGKMLRDFAQTMAPGDIVFAKLRTKAVLGYGIVESNYIYDPMGDPFCHIRKIKWISKERCDMPDNLRLPQQSLSSVDRRPELMEVLSDFYDLGPITPPVPIIYTKKDALKDLFMTEEKLVTAIESLKRKKNIILQGAPGTGKTFVAHRLAYLLMGVADETRAPMVQFHQSTCYEDFIQGYRPDGNGGFELKDGAFYTFCQDALNEPDKSFVFIIDEINRGNLSKIFGELMMLTEVTPRLRGRIHVADSYRRMTHRTGRMQCEFDELSHDTPVNRILSGTSHRLLKSEALTTKIRHALRVACELLPQVTPVRITDSSFHRIQLHRNTRNYRLLMGLCRLVHQCLLPEEHQGKRRFRDILKDETIMHDLFEAFVRNFAIRHCTGAMVSAMPIQWQATELSEHAFEHLPWMFTDVTIAWPDRKLILDCKYYHAAMVQRDSRTKFRSGHLYQLHAYVTNKAVETGWENVEGMLLYPTNGDAFDDTFKLHDRHKIRVSTVNLHQPWGNIEKELLGLLSPAATIA